MRLFDKFRNPTIHAKLVDKGAKAKVNLINMNSEQVMILLYMTIKHIAKSLNVDPRYIMNRLQDLDRQVTRAHKDEVKQAKYGKKKKRK